MWLNNWDTQLQRLLVFYPRPSTGIASHCRARRCCCGSGAYKVCGVNLNTVAPFRLHFCKGHFCRFQRHWVLNMAKADTDTRSVAHRVCFHINDIAVKRPSCCTKDELETIISLNVEAGQLCRRVLEGLRYRSEPLRISVNL